LDQLKAAYRNDSLQYQRVLSLDKKLLQAAEMRYQVFFAAMQGQLDGTLDYNDADAVYLRIRGFALRNEAPKLGAFWSPTSRITLKHAAWLMYARCSSSMSLMENPR
jgi:hypothetical protein